MTTDDAPIPGPPRSALVLTNSRTRGSLTAVRALGRAGWRVGVGSPDGDGLAARSRWCGARHVVPRPRGDGRPFVAAVRSAVETADYDVVVGGADDWAAACATWADELPCAVGHPGAEAVARGMDKLDLADLADAHGLCSPRTVLATDQALRRWDGPVLVKCRRHWQEGTTAWARIEASRFATGAQARDAVTRIRAAGLEAVLQEPVDGDLCALVGVVVDGRLHGRVQQRTAGTWPVPLGVSARAWSVPVDEQLAERASALLADLRWEGIVELQFLHDGRAEPVLIDLNGRYYGSMALAIEAGPNLPDVALRLALGEDVHPPEDGAVGVRYVWTAGELRRAVAERDGGLAADLARATRWAVGASARSVLDREDPRPMLWLAGQRLRRRRE